ncbi:hypothetical protein [Aureimonas sp. AU12]|uniref:hypothetical protein n=1 Tax=Aureimonas sp. AU12 TaxID=1638161 RepID=UPI0007808BB9|nr:hypothetical protein [Aureimonas sp. AU12]
MADDEITTLIWGHRTQKPDPHAWNIGGSMREQTAARWESLRHAINYAVGMQDDREREDLHPWIRTPQGHVYSPATIEVMAAVMLEPRERLSKASARGSDVGVPRLTPDRFLRVARPAG